MNRLLTTITRRVGRMRRRRRVGRAYDMALEIARILKPGMTVLDVGCGNGFIAHHLRGLLKSRVVGLDLERTIRARIDYLPYDGRHFPIHERCFDAVLLCYVLHHAQDAKLVLDEVRRVLKEAGLAIVYEDSPTGLWDKAVCWTHNVQWRRRTGPCTFQLESDWQRVFQLAGFRVINQRQLSRWRNVAHPVSRNFFILRTDVSATAITQQRRAESITPTLQREIPAST